MAFSFVHITDTHFVAKGERLYGLDPRARLDAAVADINARCGDAAFAVVTGDLTHWGEEAAYTNFAECMAALRIPCIAMVGNHDRRVPCLAQIPAAPRDANGFVQGTRQTEHGLFVFLDTLDETSHAGQMCDKRLAWLERTLRAAPADMPFFVFMHHPPFPVGIDAMDQIALKEAEAFAAVIAPYRARIRHLFFGHVHRPISGSYGTIPFSTLRGTNHQVWFDLDPTAEHLASHEPPAYGVVLVSDTSVVVHTHDFLDESRRFPFEPPHGQDGRTYALTMTEA